MPTSTIRIFKNKQVGKNASITPGTPVYLGKVGPDARFWMDASWAGSGAIKIVQRICDTPEGTYYQPSTAVATTIVASMAAGRNRFSASLVGSEWFKPRVVEKNIATGTIDLTMIIRY
uniref:Uncharacterized protein n=2 Tax=viral metagenome TaxID=1070528 RepID=A0A6H1ZHU3_9ZZZZ